MAVVVVVAVVVAVVIVFVVVVVVSGTLGCWCGQTPGGGSGSWQGQSAHPEYK